MFQKAEHTGIYGKAMYQYYQYEDFLSHRNIEEGLDSYIDLWEATKKYLEYYEPISKRNEEFLYAIYLSLVEEAVGNIFTAELNTEKKLELLVKIFSHSVWTDELRRDADLMFRNLTVRKMFISEIKQKILFLLENESYPAEKSAFLHIWIFYEEMMNRMKFAVIYSIYLVAGYMIASPVV